MRVRVIGRLLTPLVVKSRIFRCQGKTCIVSNLPYDDWAAPYRHRCRRVLVVKQGRNCYPFQQRACIGFVHVDFKTKTRTQAYKEINRILQITCLGKLTAWGYGRVSWLQVHFYSATSPVYNRKPRFRILKGLPQGLTKDEQTLITVALLHDLVDNPCHPSKLGRSLVIPDPAIRWLCEHHHDSHSPSTPPALLLLQEADHRTSAYARLYKSPTRKRKLEPVNLAPVVVQLQSTLKTSVYQLYTLIYTSSELHSVVASKDHPTETLREHLLGTTNWVMYLLRTRHRNPGAAAPCAGVPGATPGPVAVEDSRDLMNQSFRGESLAK